MVIKKIEYNNGKFPKEILQKAIAQREAIIPELLMILEATCNNAEQLAKEDNYVAHIYALYLLAQFREQKAYPLIYTLLSKPYEVIDSLLGDVITEGLPGILASVCDGNIGLIKNLIENQQLDGFIRGSALNSLVVMVAQGIKTREEIMDYILSLFQDKLERECSPVWDALIGCCYYLHLEEVIDEINIAYNEGLVEPFYISMEEMQEQFRKNKSTVLEKLYHNSSYCLINDTIEELEDWACFNENIDDIRLDIKNIEKLNDKQEIIKVKNEPYHNEFKIGRNDPCPCGSEKKYKKCCGQHI